MGIGHYRELVVIGAGAAGLIGAIVSARRGVAVTILEKSSKAGRKIFVSGNGRCNIGNRFISTDRYHSSNLDFLEEVFRQISPDRVWEFLNSLGIEIEEESEGRLYPMGRYASSVVEMLLRECDRLGIEIIYNFEVAYIKKRDSIFEIKSSTNATISSKYLLVASGSMAAPSLGGGGEILDILKNLGHNIIPPLPALVALSSYQKGWAMGAEGVKIDSFITLRVDGIDAISKRGDILFTDYGISGLAILDISIEASLSLNSGSYCELVIDLMPRYSQKELTDLMLKRVSKSRDLPIKLWLAGIVHKKLVNLILKEASHLNIQTEANLGKKSIKSLVYAIKHITMPIADTRGFKYAEVSLGGVDCTEVNPSTMESKLIKNLYFAGEVLDITGDRGGFNFYFAWLSGLISGKAISDKGI